MRLSSFHTRTECLRTRLIEAAGRWCVCWAEGPACNARLLGARHSADGRCARSNAENPGRRHLVVSLDFGEQRLVGAMVLS